MTSATLDRPAETFDRSLRQRLDALERANEVRTKRATLKRDIAGGRVSVVAVLLDPPACMETAKVFDVLLCVRKYGRVKVNKVLTQCRVSPSKTVGGLSQRQRDEIVALLGGAAPVVGQRRSGVRTAPVFAPAMTASAPRPAPRVVPGAVHALDLGGRTAVASDGDGVASACGRVVPVDRATLLPDAVTCAACRGKRGLRC